MIAKNSPVPVHVQLREILRHALEEGEYKPGDKFLSESEVAKRFGVSKATARRVMDDLLREGLIIRVPGKGTFVARRKFVERLTELIGFTKDMERRGHVPRTKVLQKKIVRPPEKVRELLKLEEGEGVLLLQRVRYASGEPMALQTAYVPLKFFPEIVDVDFERESLYAVFQRFGRTPAWAKQDMEAIVLQDEKQAELLGTSLGAPGLLSERLTYDLEGNPIEFTVTLFRGERYRFTVHLTNPELVKDGRYFSAH